MSCLARKVFELMNLLLLHVFAIVILATCKATSTGSSTYVYIISVGCHRKLGRLTLRPNDQRSLSSYMQSTRTDLYFLDTERASLCIQRIDTIIELSLPK